MSRVKIKNKEYVSIGKWKMFLESDKESHTVLISYGNYGWWDVVFVPKYLSADLERYSLPRASMRGRRWAGAPRGYSKDTLRDLNEYILKNGKEIWFTNGKD